MGNVKVKFNQTSAGSYGVAREGDTLVLSEKVAKELEEKGVLKITGSSSEDESVPTSGGVRFAEEKAQGPKAEGETNPKDATGKKAAAKKSSSKK